MSPGAAWRRIVRRAAPRLAPLGLVAGLALGCAGAPPRDDGPSSAPSWVLGPPPGCAAGFSGPTLDPGDAIRAARRSALEGLAASWLGVRIVSEQSLLSSRAREWTLQETRGVLIGSRIVALAVGPDLRLRGPRARREVFALACPADRPDTAMAFAGQPDWLLDPSRAGRGLCALGVGGPTRRPDDQTSAALRDARRGLAEALEIRIQRRSFDDLRGPLRVVSRSEASARARRIAAGVDRLEVRWLDERGRGPLMTSGVLYAVACLEPGGGPPSAEVARRSAPSGFPGSPTGPPWPR